MFDVVAMGEMLIDFTPSGLSPAGNELFECNPGGGPANLLVALARLGGKGCFIGKVGDDKFGRHLAGVLRRDGVAEDGLVYSAQANTSLAFVHLDSGGERSFSFYRKPGADLLMTYDEVKPGLIENARVFHFGAVCLTDEPVRSACMRAAGYAREKGVIVSFDPNWRPPLWLSDALAKQCILDAVPLADILKVSEVEMELLTGETEPAKGSAALLSMGPSLVFVTMGAAGCHFRSQNGEGFVPPYPVAAVDTTGAGDSFTAAILNRFLAHKKPIARLSQDEVYQMAAFANAVGALCVQKRGGVPAMPTMDEVLRFIDGNRLGRQA